MSYSNLPRLKLLASRESRHSHIEFHSGRLRVNFPLQADLKGWSSDSSHHTGVVIWCYVNWEYCSHQNVGNLESEPHMYKRTVRHERGRSGDINFGAGVEENLLIAVLCYNWWPKVYNSMKSRYGYNLKSCFLKPSNQSNIVLDISTNHKIYKLLQISLPSLPLKYSHIISQTSIIRQ